MLFLGVCCCIRVMRTNKFFPRRIKIPFDYYVNADSDFVLFKNIVVEVSEQYLIGFEPLVADGGEFRNENNY